VKKAFLDTQDGQISYLTAGRGKTLLLLHKTSLSSLEYETVLPILSAHHHVIAMDTPGYGHSDKPTRSFRIEDYAKSVVRFLEGLHVESVYLLGHLTGAAIAVEAAVLRPDLVKKLILASCPYYESETLSLRKKAFHFGLEGIAEDGSHLTALWRRYREIMPNAKAENIQKTILGYLLAGPRAHDGHQAVFGYRIEERLPKVQCPALLISGGCYDIFHERMETVKGLIPNCRTMTIQDGGDLIPLEKPEAFSRAVLKFLKDGRTGDR
jgi:pimeloyl-ACP methyl ester carboxylesterase